jgi:hypothetical protein
MDNEEGKTVNETQGSLTKGGVSNGHVDSPSLRRSSRRTREEFENDSGSEEDAGPQKKV